MTTFDFTRVREFADGLNQTLDRCDHGEGTQCASIEASLSLYAECCEKFCRTVSQWARDVFCGSVAFDPTAEKMWVAELERLFARAVRTLEAIGRLEHRCYTLDEQRKLESAVWNLNRLRENWVTPKLAVGPGARQRLDDQASAAARDRIKALAPLPGGWQPDDPDQRRTFQVIRSRRLKAKNG